MNLRLFTRLFLLGAILALPAPAPACPLCKEAISTPSADEEVNNLPRAYNSSIYLMIGVPYLTLGIVGFAIYRGVRQNDEYRDKTATSDVNRPLRSDISREGSGSKN